MTNALYGKGRELFLNGDIDWANDTIKVVLVDKDASTGYTVSIDADDFLSDIPAGCRIATSAALDAKSSTLGVADGGDVTFSTVAAGDPCDVIVIYKDTGDAATSPLIAYIDTATGLPVTPNGGDIIIQWDSGTNKIFKL
jgi:hypothetical protein